ncbi:MATE family efflux transporter [Campylobacter sp. MIT 21-1685]|uniref:MATE family efflux transporter n=1 Tax=unclassified Campylobacter TaxID=2593542 RepID=UPI00224AA284|nr:MULTISPECIES: MATE family efflux transporter [unclassified Campylobacter]MCX2683452.1 MATE family efflux transporter [Campylobacter sp. MIT 21-1684]MCX2751726.1 MATE family efflux transporter [Campylobacter sp. MIT 21-1682]MCX2807928.1 MATE family efflux transporter [Campylobacter sp. MIT 21-1685]
MTYLYLKSPLYLLFRCALPNMIGSFFLSFYFIIDGIFVGKFLGSEALAAMGIVMPFIMVAFALSDMVAVGASVQVSMRLGKNKLKEARIIFSTSLVVIFLISLLISLVFYFLSPFLIGLLNSEDTLKNLALEFLNIFLYFMPLLVFYYPFDVFLRVCGKNFYCMIMNVIIALSNIFLDYLFIVVFGWGLYSVALATCIGFSLSVLFGLLPFLFNRLVLQFSKILLDFKILCNIFYNGSSEFFGSISHSGFAICINVFLLELGGSIAVAAFGIIIYIDSLITTLVMGLNEALMPALSFNYARKNSKQLKALIYYTFGASLFFCFVAFVVCILFSENLVNFFTNDTTLLELASFGLCIYVLNYLAAWYNFTARSLLTSLNQASASLILGLAQNIFIPLCMLCVLAYFLGLKGIFATAFVSESICIILSIFLISKTLKF